MFQWPKSSKGGNAAHGEAPAFHDIGDLKGQVAVVSGSTSGIGLALARDAPQPDVGASGAVTPGAMDGRRR